MTNGWTMLHSAVTKGTVEIVKYFFGKGVDVRKGHPSVFLPFTSAHFFRDILLFPPFL